jgi:hypothetical protein
VIGRFDKLVVPADSEIEKSCKRIFFKRVVRGIRGEKLAGLERFEAQ